MDQTISGEKIIAGLETLVENACKAGTNAFGYGIWSHHIKPMIPLALELAELYGADREIVTIAVLLHDLAGIEDSRNQKNHHIAGAERAQAILEEYHYPVEKIEMVKLCILNHRGSVPNEKNSKEEICVADADAVIHLKEISSLFYAAYVELGMNIEDGQRWIREKIIKDYRKLSAGSREKYKADFEYMIALLEESGD